MYQHDGFWQRWDTPRDFELETSVWKTGKAPWKCDDDCDSITTNQEFWTNRRVLVTGATGIVGSWLVKICWRLVRTWWLCAQRRSTV